MKTNRDKGNDSPDRTQQGEESEVIRDNQGLTDKKDGFPSGPSKPEKQNENAISEIPHVPLSPLSEPENFAAKNFSEGLVKDNHPLNLPVQTRITTQYESCLDVPFEDIFRWWEEKTKGYKDLAMVRGLCLYDRYFLLVQIFGRQDMLHPWLYARCREVEREPDNYLDLWSRFHYKSTIITYAGTIQEVLKDPDLTVGIFSHVKAIARGFLAQIKRELEGNVKLKELFPDILYENPERQSPSWSVDGGLIVKRHTNPKEPTISGWGLVDGQPVAAHFRLRIYDDVVVKESVSTPEQVTKTTEAFDVSANLGTEDGRRWMVGTRWSYADTYAEIIKRNTCKVRLYPATDDGTFTGKPVLWSDAFNEKMKWDQTEPIYACQCLQNPLAGSQKMFDVEDLQVYEVRPETIAVYILIDPARSKKTDSDNTAMVVVGLDYAANKYVLDGFNHKMDLQERWQNTARLYQRWKQTTGVQAIYVGYESFAAQADLDYFHEQQNLTKLHFPIVELAWPREGGGSKIDRVQRLGPDMRSHKIFLPYATDDKNLTAAQRKMSQGYDYRIARKIKRKDQNNETYDLAEQLKSQIFYFPYGGKKDLVDALSRIYDMEPRAPSYREQRYSEPEFV
jgi:hypothetical protein